LIAWDENLMAAGYERIGDAWVYLILAHEWGHAIQARLESDQVSVAAELQADCLAGATLFGAAERGFLTFERGDIEELQETLSAVADDYPWTDESDHGNAQQRIAAFNRGAEGGVQSCIPR
jgi:predicted metalloprotease